MLQRTVLTILTSFLVLFTQAQKSKITGKVISSKTGEALIGATVSVDGKNKKVQSDQNGMFSISGLEEGSYSITCTYVSYSAKTISNIKVNGTEVVTQDFVMDKAGDMSAVVVKSSGGLNKPKETVSSLLVAQKNSASVSDGISAETIKRTPDKNTSDVIKRVSGATIQDDRFVIVRGLNDRYNAAFINGAPLPSSEPDRKAFSFDIFPANILDNIIIVKTATPDVPAEFAGGTVFINTKDVVSKNFQSVSFGNGFNLQSTYRSGVTYSGGKLDFLGIDDGTRALPGYFPNTNDFPRPASQNPGLAKDWNNTWGTRNINQKANLNLQYVNGWTIQKKQRDFLSGMFALTYNRTYTNTTGYRQLYITDLYDPTNPGLEYYSNQTQSSENVLLGGVANFSLKVDNNNSISFKNIYSINSEDKVISRDGYNTNVYAQTEKNIWFTSNKLYSSQLIGEHFIKKSKIKANWLMGVSAVNRTIPDLRTTIYTKADSLAPLEANISSEAEIGIGGSIYYANMKELSQVAKFDLQRSFEVSKKFITNIKIGYYYQKRDRDYDQRVFSMIKSNIFYFNQAYKYLPPDQIYQGHIGDSSGFMLSERLDYTNNYSAKTELNAAYLMFDQRLWNFVRLIYGIRQENFNINLNLPVGPDASVVVNNRVNDILPSANVIFSLNSKQNLRFCYSKTLNRPEFRELCPGKFFDYATRFVTNGDTSIKRALVDNFDFRYEIYPGKGQVFTLTTFYKKFQNPIEQATAPEKGDEAAYFNVLGAKNMGVEAEFRTTLSTLIPNTNERSILNNFTLSSNFSYIKSSVTAKKAGDTSTQIQDRPLQGQSPYTFNGSIIYQSKNGWTATFSANRYGDRLYAVGNIKNPDIWEKGRTVLDFQISKIFENDGLEFKINARDLLAQKIIFYENSDNQKGYNPQTDFIRISRTLGQTVSFTITQRF